MVNIIDVLKKAGNKAKEGTEPADIDPRDAVAIDAVTQDKALRSQRRQLRVMNEQVEKERLGEELRRRILERERDMMIGKSPLKQDQSFFNRGIDDKPMTGRKNRKVQHSFLGRYPLN